MNLSSSKRFDSIASGYATSEVHSGSPTLDRLHKLLPAVDSVCDIASGAGQQVLDSPVSPRKSYVLHKKRYFYNFFIPYKSSRARRVSQRHSKIFNYRKSVLQHRRDLCSIFYSRISNVLLFKQGNHLFTVNNVFIAIEYVVSQLGNGCPVCPVIYKLKRYVKQLIQFFVLLLFAGGKTL